MNNKNYYVKKFEENYSQSRETELIEYLNQRNAQVPKLISSHPKEKTIKMQNVGESLHSFFNNCNSEKSINPSQILKILRESINIGYEISKLDVWHLDLALRNFTYLKSQKPFSKSIFLIDFSVTVSPLYLLQKPLWLRPDTKYHHSELVQALEKDWINFFKKNSIRVPKIINNEFTIPIEKYNSYWNPQLYVQDLKNPICIITHSLGIMIYDFLINYSELMPEVKKNKLDKLKKIALGLKNLRSSTVAHERINKLLKSFDLIVYELEIPSNETPRPRIHEGADDNKKAYVYSKNIEAISFSKFSKENILAFIILCFGFFVTNEAYISHDIVLGNTAFNVALVAIGIPIIYALLVLTTWKFFNFFKVFVRIESLILFYYFFELLYRDAGWLFLSIIFMSVITSFGFTIKNTKIL